MPSRLPTQPSTPRLSEVARHLILPSGIVSTGWPAVRDTARNLGFGYDEWQSGLGAAMLAKRASGLYAASVGGVLFSISRQVGKTYTVGSIVIILCILFPGTKVLWTAHRSRTSGETFKSMKGMVGRKKVAPYVVATRQANGEQEITFANGSRILFGARENGFGRGFEAVDIEVFDEAQILTEKALDDMVPAVNTSPNGLIIYMGTPPKPSDPSEVFVGRRREAIAAEKARAAGEDVELDTMFVEISADRGADVNDRAQWRKANPSYPHRTPETSILRMLKQLGPESFYREGLGIWDDDSGGARAISATLWRMLEVDVAPEGQVAFGVAFSQDGERVSIGGARLHEGGVHVETIEAGEQTEGVEVLADWLAERRRTAIAFVLSGQGAADLAAELKKRRVAPNKIIVASTGQYLSACQMTWNLLRDRSLSHLSTAGFKALADSGGLTSWSSPLDASVAVCDKQVRTRTGAWGWNATTPDGDETPLEAVTLAVYGVKTKARRATTGEVAIA